MGKKLAIKGHPTRGKEVIELLEMMGGINKNMLSAHIGDVLNPHIYFLEPDFSDNRIVWYYLLGLEWDGRASEMIIFTLEEFYRKYPFKIGDKVIDLKTNKIAEVYKMHWSENTNCVYYDIKYPNNYGCQRRRMDLKSMDNTKPSKMKNVLAELLDHIKTTPKEELEKEFKEIEEWSNVGPTVEEFITFCECVNKKPPYPKTYNECYNILNCFNFTDVEQYNFENDWRLTIKDKNYGNMMNTFVKLLICRDTYWKIAGEELGLDKPWEPKYEALVNNTFFTIQTFNGEIDKSATSHRNSILAFPTKEMRDAFYENFKDLIEQCKELL